ncbi:MAG: T9SS type A sorting domain-containing protein [Chitinophagales bacterium]
MKKFYTVFLLLFSCSAFSATIASDGFNNSSSFSITGGAYYTGNSATGDRPASVPFFSEGTYSYGFTGASGSATLISPDYNSSTYSSIQMTLKVAAFSIGSTGNGVDGSDSVRIDVSPDGGTTWYNTVSLVGNSNAYWNYTATGNASTAYDGNNTTVVFAPAGGGSRTTDGYSTMSITGLPAVTNLKFRIFLQDNSTSERWVIDDFQLTGTLACTPPADPSGSISGTTPACDSTQLYFSGAAPSGVTYYWQTSAGGTSTTNDAAASYKVTTSGNYYVRAQDNSTSCWSTNATTAYPVTINTGIAITATTPTDQTVTAGTTATFTVTATGTGLNYQWQEDQGSGWNNVGTNSNSYTTATTTGAMNGWLYQCIVSGSSPCASVTSRTATLTVNVPLSAGFVTASGSTAENVSTYQIGVTVNTAPSSNLVLRVTDAGTGTASAVTDFNFTTTNLTFLPSGTYPQTQYATVTILNDLSPESTKYRNFNLARISGPAVTPSPNVHQMTIVDDDTTEGIIINEFSQGANNAAYVELVVIGVPGTTVDLRGWIIDDNSGIFSGGYGSQLGIADGHIKFSNDCNWEKVPAGSIIVVYVNDQTGGTPVKNNKITSLGLADDPTDANLDYVYVIGVNFYNTGSCSTASANTYFTSDCTLPNISSYDVYTPASYTNPDLATAQFRNGGDAVQVRDQTGTYFMGLSYGSKGSGSNCASCAINAANHPDYTTYGTNALYFTGTNNVTYAFQNTGDNDYRKLSNWSKITTASPNSLETPGSSNSAANNTWILSMRGLFDVVLDNQNYTCQLGPNQSRYYLDSLDKIIYHIKNNISTDHGSFMAQTILHDDATTGLGFQNSNLAGQPLFMQKTFAASPTTASPANYKIKFFVSTQELQDYCDYINPILNSIPGYYTNHNHTPSEVKGHLKIYRTSTTDRAWTVTSDAQVQIVTPTIGTYGAFTTFEYDGFTGFSGYALGDIVTPDIGLPVELTGFDAKCTHDVVALNWATASEKNFDHFEVERSTDAIHFSSLGQVKANGASNQIENYKFTDEYPLNGTNYYRLKMLDIGDDAASYSGIITTKCDESATGLQITYSATNGITIFLNTAETKNMQFSIYEISGKLIYSEDKTIESGSFRFSLNFKQSLADGIYIVRVIDGNKLTSQKIWVH